MKLALNDLGQRLEMMRKALDLSQKDVAERIETTQAQVSRMESGTGGSLPVLIDLLNLYADHFHLGSFFLPHFEIVKNSEGVRQQDAYYTIVVERLKMLRSTVSHEITEIIGAIDNQPA